MRNLFFVHLCVLLCSWVCGAVVRTQKRGCQCKQSVSAKECVRHAEKPWGQSPKEEGRGEERKEGRKGEENGTQNKRVR